MSEVGKVEFAPDYKSKSMSATDVAKRMDRIIATDLKRQAERSQLEREVIEKAKEVTSNEVRGNWDALVAYRELCGAVDALIEFESSQQQTKFAPPVD